MHKFYPWQEVEWEHLLARKNNGNLPHALLFSGTEGMGKFDFALAFGEMILCKNALHQACGECSSCKLLLAGNHPDLVVIRPEEEKKTIGIDKIRALINIFSQTAQQGNYQVAIIHPADGMNIAAANALLKTLEEPLGRVIIILVSSQPSAMPATIRSRCQNLTFRPNNSKLIRLWLEQQLESYSAGDNFNIDLLLSLTGNAPLQALAFAKENKLQERKQLLDDFFAALTGKADPLKNASKFINSDLNFLVTHITFVIHDLIKIKNGSTNAFLINKDREAELLQLSSKISIERLFEYLTELQKITKLMNEGINFNKQLLLENIFYVS